MHSSLHVSEDEDSENFADLLFSMNSAKMAAAVKNIVHFSGSMDEGLAHELIN